MKDSIRSMKEWASLVSIADKAIDKQYATVVLAQLVIAIEDGDLGAAREWLMVALLTSTTDEIQDFRAYLARRVAANADPEVLAPVSALLAALRKRLAETFEARADASLDHVMNLLRKIAGEELPS